MSAQFQKSDQRAVIEFPQSIPVHNGKFYPLKTAKVNAGIFPLWYLKYKKTVISAI